MVHIALICHPENHPECHIRFTTSYVVSNIRLMDEKQRESASDHTRRGAAESNMDESAASESTNYRTIDGTGIL